MSPLEHFRDRAETPQHTVQFSSGDGPLVSKVTAYLSAGLKLGDALLVIGTADRNALLARGLEESGHDLESATAQRRLLFADADQTLQRCLVGGEPDWWRFQRTLGALIGELHSESDRTLRAYGEMVGVLWTQGQFAAAARVEQFWNKTLSATSFHLFCSYPIDVLDPDFQPTALDPILSAHTHLVSGHPHQGLTAAIERAIAEVLGPDALEPNSIKAVGSPAWPAMPEDEALILWLRSQFPSRAGEILDLARQYVEEREFAV